ncbi:MAG: apolipoprotein N-acyltransferase [Dermatophilaceae bacterium]
MLDDRPAAVTSAVPPAATDPPGSSVGRSTSDRPIRLWQRLAAAVAGGVALWSAFPTVDLWWLAPVGVALLAGATITAGGPRGFAVGLVGGLAYFVPTLSWSGTYVGPVPWLALAVLQALYVAAMCAVTGFAGRRLVASGRHLSALAVIPVAWVVQEWARGSTPYGGFPWARLAFSQSDSPLLHVARWAGAPGMTFAVAAVGAGLLAVGFGVADRRRAVVVFGVAAAVGPWGASVIPLPTDGRTAAVGFVQGNVPTPGLDFNAERRAVLDNHVRGTESLMTRAPDDLTLVVWPENSADIDPIRNADAAAQVERAREAAGVPLVVGAVLSEPPGRSSNTSLFYDGRGASPQRYTKLHPVPFAEYIPHREFFRLFSPAADLAGNFVAGESIEVFQVPAPGGSYLALPTICFEVAYDKLVRESVAAAGSQDGLLLVQTNNATFGYTAESEQQLAISRVRAAEHGRSVIHVSTVGVSGVVAPDGSITQRTGLFTAEQSVGRPVLRSERSPSDRLGPLPEFASLGVLVVLGTGSVLVGRHVKVGTPVRRAAPTDE